MFKIIFLFFFLFFITNSYAYNTALGFYGAFTSAISYCPEQEVEAWNCYWCTLMPNITLIKTFWDSRTSTYSYIAFDSKNNHYLLTFEGTQDFKDWLIDIDFIKLIPYKHHPTAKIHSGFWYAYNSIRDELLQTIKEYNISNLFVTGHSLGGALATISSLDIAETIGNITITMVNLGSPRIGNKEYTILFNHSIKKYYRITHGKDPVVHLPPMIFGYYHISNEIFYPNSTLIYENCSLNEDPKCSNSEPFDLFATQDHRNYLGFYISKCSMQIEDPY